MGVSLEQSGLPNLSKVTIGALVLYFSYETVVAFEYDAGAGYLFEVSVNVWGPTTGKHLNQIDGGSAFAKGRRLSRDEFKRRLDEVLTVAGLS